jgi:hypothetical protein
MANSPQLPATTVGEIGNQPGLEAAASLAEVIVLVCAGARLIIGQWTGVQFGPHRWEVKPENIGAEEVSLVRDWSAAHGRIPSE